MKFSFKKKDEDFLVELEQESDDKIQHQNTNNQIVSHTALTPDEVLSGFRDNKATPLNKTGALDNLKKRVTGSNDKENDSPSQKVFAEPLFSEPETTEKKETPEIKEKDVAKPTLLDKCLPYIKDENGVEADLNAEPLYKLQSVAEILRTNSEKALESLSEKYDIEFDDLGHTPKQEITKPSPNPTPKPEQKQVYKPTPNKEPKTEEPTPIERELFEEKIPIKNIQSNVKYIISDIDVPTTKSPLNNTENMQNTGTITFTPVNIGKKGKSSLKVSSKTRPIDLTGELVKLPENTAETENEVYLEKNEFEDYVPKEEFDQPKDAGKFIRKFAIKKRNAFLITTFSIILTIILSLTKLPFMSQIILEHTKVLMIISSAITGIIILLNCRMFTAFKNIFSKYSLPDISASLASIITAAYAVFGIIDNIIITDVLLLLSIILAFRSLTAYYKTSYNLSNLKIICNNNQKKAVRLINDNAVTFAMAKNTIEGDVLIAAPQSTDHINDYIKYSSFGKFFGGKLPILTVISVIVSVILGFACASYFDGISYGLYAATAIQCFTALPVAFFIDTLPLYRASKKLNKKGGMISGKTAADHLEMANAIVLDSCDLFPSGMITLHQMKVLSDNNLEDTIIRAASLTESLNSPLAPIFKKIAGTGNITVFPDSDTVKYEDRMGISGWVDNRLLFIGNRTLMEAHGIEVPSVEIDRKILRQGFFPVYVATRDKACALLIIQYNIDREIARELRYLTSLGVTLLLNNCDPNLIEEMICDYFGLYSDSVKVMSAAGCHMYKNTVTPLKSVSAPAAFKSNPLTFVSIINCASKIKKSNTLLTVMYILSLVVGTVIFAYTSLSGSGTLIRESTLLIYGLLSTVLSYIIYFFARP